MAMSVSIRACPACHSLLMGDSANCPHCGHVLDPARADEFVPLIPAESVVSSEAEAPCPKCGEMVRTGLVRCWNCSSFMQAEIEEAYREMQANPSATVYSNVSHNTMAPRPGSSEAVAVGTGHISVNETSPVEMESAGDDFQLAAGVSSSGDGDDDFQLTRSSELDDDDFEVRVMPGVEVSPSSVSEVATTESESYGLAETNEPEEIAEPEPEAEPIPEAPAEAAAEEEAPIPERPTRGAAPDDEAHSVTTAGDVLLAAALQEESESEKRGKKARAKAQATGLLIFCPNGHRVKVQEKHRGRAGKCPQCKALFIVPALPKPETLAEETPEAAAAAAETAAAAAAGPTTGRFKDWLLDLHLHIVNPAKLKLKAGSLAGEFETVDVTFSDRELLIASLPASGGLLGGSKKKEATRTALRDYLTADKPLDAVPVSRCFCYTQNDIGQFRVIQPPDPSEESLIGSIPVFGVGRIAVRLPGGAIVGEKTCLSFTLTEFREFSRLMENIFGIPRLGASLGIPLDNDAVDQKCHYTDAVFPALEGVEYYKADPKFKLVITGRKCQGCGLVVCEDARKKEKIGGASGSGIAKAKCPKCKQKFGDTTFYKIEVPAAAPPPAPAK